MWNEITYPFQTSTVQPLKFENGYVISPILFYACDCLSMLELKLSCVNKSGSWYWNKDVPENLGQYHGYCCPSDLRRQAISSL